MGAASKPMRERFDCDPNQNLVTISAFRLTLQSIHSNANTHRQYLTYAPLICRRGLKSWTIPKQCDFWVPLT